MTQATYDSERHVWNAFEAHYTSRGTGRRLYTSAIYGARAEAVAEITEACPNVRLGSITTWRAHKQSDGRWFAASDMRDAF